MSSNKSRERDDLKNSQKLGSKKKKTSSSLIRFKVKEEEIFEKSTFHILKKERDHSPKKHSPKKRVKKIL